MKCFVRSISNFQMLADMCNCFFTSIFGKYVLVDAENFVKRVYTSLLHLGQKSPENITARKMKFSIKVFFSKSQFRRFLLIWSHLLKKSSARKLHCLCSVPFFSQERVTD